MTRNQKILFNLIGSAIQAFGLYNVHAMSGVTEGGILGLTLLLDHWFHLSPAVSSFILNFICYFIGWRVLGLSFVKYSILAGGSFSVFYYIIYFMLYNYTTIDILHGIIKYRIIDLDVYVLLRKRASTKRL